MSFKEIEQLLARYYEGETTRAEEKLLKEFFARDDVPVNLRPHQPMFRFFTAEATHTLSDEQQDKVLIRRIEQYQREASTVRTHPGKRRLYYFSGIAAGLLILFSLVFAIRNEVSRRHHDELLTSSAEGAYTQTKQALLLVSVGLNTGLDAVQHFKTLDKAMEKIQRINKFYNYQNQFINPEWMQAPSTDK